MLCSDFTQRNYSLFYCNLHNRSWSHNSHSTAEVCKIPSNCHIWWNCITGWKNKKKLWISSNWVWHSEDYKKELEIIWKLLICIRHQIRSDQSLSRVRLFVTPWITAHQVSLSITNFWSSLRLMPIESVIPSNHLILCHPLLLLPPIPPSIRVFSNESTLHMRWPKVLEFQL